MYIKTLKLRNIGPYYGETIFDFRVNQSSNKNIILIGGNNGSGKTTLLNSLKISLFGAHAYGFITNSNTYFQIIKGLLNKAAISDNKRVFLTEIDYDVVERYETNSYSVKRKWVLNGDNLDEQLSVTKNGKHLNEEALENYVYHLKQQITPNLIESFMFDGETVANLIENDDLSIYLKNVFYNAFNFNIIEQFQSDMSKYLQKAQSKAQLTDEEADLLKNKNELNAIKKNIQRLDLLIAKCDSDIKNENNKLSEQLGLFKNLGGLTEKEMKKLKADFSTMEKDRLKKINAIKSFFENYYPIAINQKLLKKAVNRMRREYPYSLANKIENMKEHITIDEKALKGLNDFLQVYNNLNEDILYQNFDEESLYNFENILSQNLRKQQKTYLETFIQIKQRIEIEGTFKSKLDKAENTKELNEIADNISSIQNKISTTDARKNEYIDEKQDSENLYEQYQKSIDVLQKEIFKANKKTNSFSIAQRIMKMNEEFILTQTKNQLHSLEKLSLVNFSNAINKNNFIQKISINPVSFELTLYDHDGNQHSKNYLSAGERQILIASIVNAMLSLSKRRLAFVFDTPLARLDKKNRKSFTQQIIQNSSNQVIVLSTDEEVVHDVLDSISKKINRTYLLKSISTNETKVLDGYFEDVR